MFTGIVETTGTIKNIQGSTFTIKAPFVSELIIGQSVAHDGVCLTVTKIHDDSYDVDLVPETLERSHFSQSPIGYELNLERCMKASDRFDGHIVQGHCDCVGKVDSIKEQDNAYNLTINIPENYILYLVEKGSVAINGISLTVTDVSKSSFGVSIIPHTWEVTNLKNIQEGDLINIETDIVAKYIVDKLLRNN